MTKCVELVQRKEIRDCGNGNEAKDKRANRTSTAYLTNDKHYDATNYDRWNTNNGDKINN